MAEEKQSRRGSSPEAWVVAVTFALTAAQLVFVAALGAHFPLVLAAIVGLAALAGGILYFRRDGARFDGLARRYRWRAIGLAVVAVIMIVQTARLSAFMVSPTCASCSVRPNSSFMLHHSCVSAYFVAADATSTTANVYDDSLYKNEQGRAKPIEQFFVDPYAYGPPFLIAPKVLLAVAGDFLHFRMLWFGVTTLLFLFALVVTARWIDGAEGVTATAFLPLVWVALPNLLTLQYGQWQPVVMAVSLFAMVAFAKNQNARGGAALAFMTASKFFPAVFIVVLALQRRWRAVAWTAAFGVVFLLATLVMFGSAPFSAFLGYELPRLDSGQALPHMFIPRHAAMNHSFMGLFVKIQVLGVPPLGRAWIRAAGWAYTLALLVLAWRVARLDRDDERPASRAAMWLALLTLAGLRAPFIGQAYALFAPSWLVTVLAARKPLDRNTVLLVVAVFAAVNVTFPPDSSFSTPMLTFIAAIPQAITVALAVIALRRPARPQPLTDRA